MINKLSLFLFVAVVALFHACSTDVVLEGEWKDIPVVYAFIDLGDTAHYVRVEKAFLEVGGNANVIAQQADSIFYDDIEVQLERANGQRFTLTRVDGNLEGYPRQAGTFASSPNYLYKIRANVIDLNGGETIRLLINRGDDLPVVEATTVVLTTLSPRDNSPSSPIQLGDYNRTIDVVWGTGQEARIFDLRMLIRYREINPANPSEQEVKTLTWVIAPAIIKTNTSSVASGSFKSRDFFQFLASAVEPTQALIREIEDIEIQVVGGGNEILEFRRISQANLGITSSGIIPVYTNISEGRGIFASRSAVRRQNLRLGAVSLDSLRNGVITKPLNFR